jgi:polar amino acid transport system substrate-binding protein
MTLRHAVIAAAFALLAGSATGQTAQPPLRTAVDGTYAPHAMPKLGGGIEGFQIDLFQEVARRMHRDITIDSASFSGLIPALQAGRYDFLAAPTTVTPERAEALLFTQGYLWTAFQFGIRKGSAPLTSWDDLKGKVVTVNKGTPYESLSKKMGEQIGFTVQTFDTEPDAVQAVVSGHAYANLAGNTVILYAASKNPLFVPDLVLKDTKAHWATPFRKDSAALRGVVEDVLKCMKKDGTVATLSEKWFGAKPAPDDLENVSFPGHGVPGLPGYEPNAPDPDCSQYK